MYQLMIDDLSKNNNTFSGVKNIFGPVISQNLSCQQRNNDQDLFIRYCSCDLPRVCRV